MIKWKGTVLSERAIFSFKNTTFFILNLFARKRQKKAEKKAKWEKSAALKRKREEDNEFDQDELDDLFKEARLLKKLKSGKITEKYDFCFSKRIHYNFS